MDLTKYELTEAKQNSQTFDKRDLAYIMPEPEYMYFRYRAECGMDVYAYKIETAPTGATIAFNIWDTDVRIPYSNTPARWIVDATAKLNERHYIITLRMIHTGTRVDVVRRYLPRKYETENQLNDRVKRHVLSYCQHLNVFGGVPSNDIEATDNGC